MTSGRLTEFGPEGGKKVERDPRNRPRRRRLGGFKRVEKGEFYEQKS